LTLLPSAMRATQRAVVQEAVQGDEHLIVVIAVGVEEIAELDQAADFGFAQG
jgi:hypothetical protein